MPREAMIPQVGPAIACRINCTVAIHPRMLPEKLDPSLIVTNRSNARVTDGNSAASAPSVTATKHNKIMRGPAGYISASGRAKKLTVREFLGIEFLPVMATPPNEQYEWCN